MKLDAQDFLWLARISISLEFDSFLTLFILFLLKSDHRRKCRFRLENYKYAVLSHSVYSQRVCFNLHNTLCVLFISFFTFKVQIDNDKCRRDRDARLSNSRLDLPNLCNGGTTRGSSRNHHHTNGHHHQSQMQQQSSHRSPSNGNLNVINNNNNNNNNNNLGSPVSSNTVSSHGNSSSGERGSSTKSNSSTGSANSGRDDMKCITPMTPSGK